MNLSPIACNRSTRRPSSRAVVIHVAYWTHNPAEHSRLMARDRVLDWPDRLRLHHLNCMQRLSNDVESAPATDECQQTLRHLTAADSPYRPRKRKGDASRFNNDSRPLFFSVTRCQPAIQLADLPPSVILLNDDQIRPSPADPFSHTRRFVRQTPEPTSVEVKSSASNQRSPYPIPLTEKTLVRDSNMQ